MVVHDSVEEPPAVIEDGAAESVQLGVGGGVETVTPAEQVTVPPPTAVAIMVYTVSPAGVTV